jgi:predicted nuclease of predicted toxin-antitoxin system
LDNAIRLYFDENVDLEVARQIRGRGVEVVTARDLGLLGDTDENHLNRAVQMGYVPMTPTFSVWLQQASNTMGSSFL